MTKRLPDSFTRAFGLRVPVVQAPMGGVAGPRLVAAAANAGALGNLPIWFFPPEAAVRTIREVRALTDRPFAVNLRADLPQEELIAAAASEGITLFNLFWGDPGALMPAVRRAGGRLIATVGDADGARAALAAGAEALILQGMEAGGHVASTTPLHDLVREAVPLAGEVPVVAAGGMVAGEDIAAVFALGAAGVVLGTALIMTDEADAHPAYQQALLDARAGDTVLTECFDGAWPQAPHRVLKNSTWRAWEAAGSPAPGSRPGEGDVILRRADGYEIPRYHASTASAGTTGEFEAAALYAGTGVGRIRRAGSLASLVDELLAAALAL